MLTYSNKIWENISNKFLKPCMNDMNREIITCYYPKITQICIKHFKASYINNSHSKSSLQKIEWMFLLEIHQEFRFNS